MFNTYNPPVSKSALRITMTTLTTSFGKSIGRGYRRSLVGNSALRTGGCPRAKQLSVWSSASAARIVAASKPAGVNAAGQHRRGDMHGYLLNKEYKEIVLRGIFQVSENESDRSQ